MPTQQLERGDEVQFNVGREDGPVEFGTVTFINKDGSVVINPKKPAVLTSRVKFFNIKRVELRK